MANVFQSVLASSQITPTDITPSNVSPVALTANDPVKPTTAGYAIESYDSVTPSSTPESVSSGDIVKIGGSGVIVDAVPTPTSITPSNSSPVALTADVAVKPSAAGYAIESYATETPSDAYPPIIPNGKIIKANGAGRFTKHAFPFLGDPPDKTYQNNTAGTSGTADITVSQKPRYIVVAIWGRNSNYRGFLGVVNVEQQKGYRMGYVASGAVNESWSGYSNYFTTISATKVTYNTAGFGENHRVQIQIFY